MTLYRSPTMLRYLLLLTALALKCHVCGSVPGFSFGSKCGSDVAEGSATCDPRADRCMTVKGTINDPDAGKYSFEIKNCSSIFVCNPTSPLYSKSNKSHVRYDRLAEKGAGHCVYVFSFFFLWEGVGGGGGVPQGL